MELDVRFEIAEVAFSDNGKTVKHTAPVAVRVRVRDAADFHIQAKCLDGPNYQLGTVDAKGVTQTPMAMVLQCQFTLTHGPDWTETFSLDLLGDGYVKSSFEDGTEIKSLARS